MPVRSDLDETRSASAAPTLSPPGIFARVVCGVDGSVESDEAVRQAGALAEEGAQLLLVSVACESGVAGLAWRPPLNPVDARAAIDRATAVAADHRVEVSGMMQSAPGVAPVLLHAAHTGDLLAVAARADPEVAGRGLGRVPGMLVRGARVPVLVTRRPPAGARFPEPVLLMREPGTRRAEHVAASIMRRHAPGAILTADAHDADTLAELAGRQHIALVVVARSDVPGRTSFAACVAQRAPCSVLIVPPPDRR